MLFIAEHPKKCRQRRKKICQLTQTCEKIAEKRKQSRE